MNLKDKFPIFTTYPKLVFLDNAATTQKPKVVIDALTDFYCKYNSNVHRGLYPLSEKATELYEDARHKIANFINAEPEEIIFTSGTTDGVNAIATSLYSSKMISSNPSILVSEKEHHSNLLPWQKLPNINLKFLEDVASFGDTNIQIVQRIGNLDVVALNYASNVTGQRNPVKKLREELPEPYFILDAAQAVGHEPIDVKELDVDFVVFSGHKMYGPMGIGVIWGKKALLDKMEPFKVGGGMIKEVNRTYATWDKIPSKFEAGTPSVADAYALGIACDFINEIGFNEITLHEAGLRKYLVEKLSTIENLKIYHPNLTENALGVVSISHSEAHPHDLAQYLGENNICVRAGHHCTQILHREVLKIPASLRISLGIYNSEEDLDKFIAFLKKGIEIYSK